MKRFVCLSFLITFGIFGCAADQPKEPDLVIKGKWLKEQNGDVMLDPQTSGLTFWRNQLLTLSDGSAHVSQRLQLHPIIAEQALLGNDSLPMLLSDEVAQSCFAEYLKEAPDLEALTVDPDDDTSFYVVTEDATRTGSMSQECQIKYADTGSTKYPTLLVHLVLQADNTLLMAHVKPLHFDPSFTVGNAPNDGIEGLAMGADRTLYLGLEKDANGHARIFSVKLSPDFWEQPGFAKVVDPKLQVPVFESGNHPINGMDFYAGKGLPGFIFAAARNDNELWIIDLSKKRKTVRKTMQFLAPTERINDKCAEWEVMDNASIEGVAVANDILWMINDPWKSHYMDNVVCETNRAKYERMAPLLFSVPIDASWFE